MSETPRTDGAVRDFGYRDEIGMWIKQDAIDPGFARQLERELIAACEERDRFRKDSEALDFLIMYFTGLGSGKVLLMYCAGNHNCPEHLRNRLEGKKT